MVLDTNVVAYCLFPGRFSDDAINLLAQITDAVVPPLWQSEFRNVLALYLRKDLLSTEVAVDIFSLAEERLSVIQPGASTSGVLELVNASSCTAHNCEFVDLAQQLDTFLITQDKKILREFPDISVTLTDALASI